MTAAIDPCYEVGMSTLTEADIEARTQAVLDDVGIDAIDVDFRSALWDAGLAFVHYPAGKGGPRRGSGSSDGGRADDP